MISSIDTSTLLFISFLLNGILSLYLFIVSRRLKKESRGVSWFIGGYFIMSLGWMAVGFQNQWPDFLSYIVSNTILVGGLFMIFHAIGLLYGGKRHESLLPWIIMAVVLVEQIIFFYIINLTYIRIIFISLFFFGALALNMLKLIRVQAYRTLPGLLFIITLSVNLLVSILRIAWTLTDTTVQSVIDQGFLLTLSSLVWLMTSSSWPLSFALIINLRIQEREQIQLKEKTILLKELHHRVKNNLQILISFLQLQSDISESKETRNQLMNATSRVQAMALVHRQLMKSSEISSIGLRRFVEELVGNIKSSLDFSKDSVELTISVVDIEILMDVGIPLGLVLNELITNSLKHAFNKQDKGSITIEITTLDERTLKGEVTDNGKGLDENLDARTACTLGLSTTIGLIENQLNGRIDFRNNKGFSCSFEIPLESYQKRV